MPNRRPLTTPLILLGAPLAINGCAHHARDAERGHVAAVPESAHATAFLEGHWVHDDGATVMEEIWFPPHPSDGATAGVLRWTTGDGTVRMYELMSLTPGDGGTVAFQLRHFGGDMSPWASESDGPLRGVVGTPEPNRLVIRCTERNGDVATITYERTGDELVSTLRFDASAGRDPIVIDFVQVD